MLAPSLSADTTEIPQWAHEKKPVKMSYNLGVGTSYPLDNIADYWKQGFHGYGRLNFLLSPKLNVWAGADFHFFPFDDEADTSVRGANLSTLNFTGDLKINLGMPLSGVNPYLFGGTGVAVPNISDSSKYFYVGETLDSIHTVTYPRKAYALIEIGGGVEYKYFFIQGCYLTIMFNRKSQSYIPITVGVKF